MCGARAAGQAAWRSRRRIGRTVCELGTQRGQLWTPRRGETTQPHVCMSQDRSETRVRRDVARRTARLQRRAQQHTATPRATDAKKTWGEIDRPGSAALPAENLEDSFANWAHNAGRVANGEYGARFSHLATLRGQLWTPRRGATARAASSHAARHELDAR